ncbi:hypothetical protein [Natrinema versiforme]|uniref:Uncharacterized protein n=1 Tax=Natrinema versiforme JCM 10478 TaxID=1227496 RepID=L9Y1D4_9EURY|nr:hypothetical protein [Natrinema versiforme]ELY67497.1 hypothetical protein C489_10414 [Natrinema versiforme JCM 10478]
MCATFSDDDIDKPVENAAGEAVGVVAAAEGDVARVRPDPSAVESIKSSLGWEGAETTIMLDRESVREITDDAVRLEGELPIQDDSPTDSGLEHDGSASDGPETEPAGSMSGIDETDIAEDMADDDGHPPTEELDAIEKRSRGMEADPTELADRDPQFSSGSADDGQASTAAEIDENPRRTDASVDPEDKSDRTDAAVDPDTLRETEATDRGPTTEDGARGLEDEPETESLTDPESGSASGSDESGDE